MYNKSSRSMATYDKFENFKVDLIEQVQKFDVAVLPYTYRKLGNTASQGYELEVPVLREISALKAGLDIVERNIDESAITSTINIDEAIHKAKDLQQEKKNVNVGLNAKVNTKNNSDLAIPDSILKEIFHSTGGRLKFDVVKTCRVMNDIKYHVIGDSAQNVVVPYLANVLYYASNVNRLDNYVSTVQLTFPPATRVLFIWSQDGLHLGIRQFNKIIVDAHGHPSKTFNAHGEHASQLGLANEAAGYIMSLTMRHVQIASEATSPHEYVYVSRSDIPKYEECYDLIANLKIKVYEQLINNEPVPVNILNTNSKGRRYDAISGLLKDLFADDLPSLDKVTTPQVIPFRYAKYFDQLQVAKLDIFNVKSQGGGKKHRKISKK